MSTAKTWRTSLCPLHGNVNRWMDISWYVTLTLGGEPSPKLQLIWDFVRVDAHALLGGQRVEKASGLAIL